MAADFLGVSKEWFPVSSSVLIRSSLVLGLDFEEDDVLDLSTTPAVSTTGPDGAFIVTMAIVFRVEPR